ncbi:hypothetical protein BDA96_03G056900 [Sorghum bicolor]|uniref:Uncharacterized protein n=2 Tax=Sorghum bicolor TaxID=4558 RepID=A0A921RAW9_SORBI|nr:transcription factor MYB82-like [Sorghum bicolor]KAG0536359.1 hypothetical protein BDA96_03G056900 [Sorghum bicolor]OQU86237.1 hypothetical protein SORBI_3003G053300 [Sorghum bicolor]|eukprot:XP_021313424.1 transcription factor MYB82-like [Sorghum bicolor]
MVRKPIHADAGANGTEANKERKGLWSPEEDERLFTQITYHGVSTWSSVAQLAGLRRSGKSCRLRWMNYLRPDLKKEPISKREEETIISLQQSLGNRWSTIAARMPGRTDNEIKNYWNSRIRKRLNAARDSTAKPAPAPAVGGEEGSANAAPPPADQHVPIPARFPVFGCQLLDLDGAGGGMSSAGSGSGESPQSSTTTSTQQNTGDESEASVGGNSSGGGGGDDINMIHFLSFDDLDYYPGDLLMDVPGAMDAWESELYSANSMMSSLC